MSEYERQYENGSDPRVLDVIDIPLAEFRPGTYQSENWLLDPDHYWTKVGTIEWDGLQAFADDAGPLWTNGRSTYNGHNDEIAEEDAHGLTSSLTLIRVEAVRLRTFAPGQAFGDSKRRLQAAFTHAGFAYRLWVTDPVYERHYLAQPDGEHRLGECFLTVSLGEPYKDACHKLVAAIIEPPATAGGANR